MQWSEVLNDKSLADLPYKMELNEYGQIVMSPASNHHGLLQVEVAFFLRSNKQGKVLVECSIDTAKGVKVADVAWGSIEFFAENGRQTPYQCAPEICVEVVFPSNSQKEINEKVSLYLQKGAQEVWLCKENGKLSIHDDSGMVKSSAFFADVPARFEY